MIIKPRYEGLLSLNNISLLGRQFGEKGQEVIAIHGEPECEQLISQEGMLQAHVLSQQSQAPKVFAKQLMQTH